MDFGLLRPEVFICCFHTPLDVYTWRPIQEQDVLGVAVSGAAIISYLQHARIAPEARVSGTKRSVSRFDVLPK